MRSRIESTDQQRVRRPPCLARIGTTATLAALSLVASASPAGASVTIGQLAPGSPPPAICTNGPVDDAQPGVSSGNTYVVPGTGTITSWSHNAAVGGGQMLKMKIFRQVAGLTYAVVGHDGPRTLTGGALNTFQASIPVKPGDVLGLNDLNASTVNNACTFATGLFSGSHVFLPGDLADGASGNFFSTSSDRVNATAVFVPTNAFSFGAIDRNRKLGTATVTVDVPNPGQLALSGKGVKAAVGAATTVNAPGTAQLLIAARGKKKRTLRRKGKVTLSPNVTYTPTGGDPSTQSLTLKLKKKRRKR